MSTSPFPNVGEATLQASREDALRWLQEQVRPVSFPTLVRALQLRTSVGWRVLADLLEDGRVVVRSGGLVIERTER